MIYVCPQCLRQGVADIFVLCSNAAQMPLERHLNIIRMAFCYPLNAFRRQMFCGGEVMAYLCATYVKNMHVMNMKNKAHSAMKRLMRFLMPVSALMLAASCNVARQALAETLIESVQDPKTGTQVFSRDYDTEPYGIAVGKMAKARKAAKREKIKEQLEKY